MEWKECSITRSCGNRFPLQVFSSCKITQSNSRLSGSSRSGIPTLRSALAPSTTHRSARSAGSPPLRLVLEQRPRHPRILRRPLPQPQQVLAPVGGDADRHQDAVLAEMQIVDRDVPTCRGPLSGSATKRVNVALRDTLRKFFGQRLQRPLRRLASTSRPRSPRECVRTADPGGAAQRKLGKRPPSIGKAPDTRSPDRDAASAQRAPASAWWRPAPRLARDPVTISVLTPPYDPTPSSPRAPGAPAPRTARGSRCGPARPAHRHREVRNQPQLHVLPSERQGNILVCGHRAGFRSGQALAGTKQRRARAVPRRPARSGSDHGFVHALPQGIDRQARALGRAQVPVLQGGHSRGESAIAVQHLPRPAQPCLS